MDPGVGVNVRGDNTTTSEDLHAQLLAELVSNPNYDIIQLDPIHDPDVVGLVVDGELRVSYRKETVYTPHSRVAGTILSRVRRQAVGANTLVQGYGRVVRNAPLPRAKKSIRPVHENVGPESVSWGSIEIPDFISERPGYEETSVDVPEFEGDFLGVKDYEALDHIREGFRSEDIRRELD